MLASPSSLPVAVGAANSGIRLPFSGPSTASPLLRTALMPANSSTARKITPTAIE